MDSLAAVQSELTQRGPGSRVTVIAELAPPAGADEVAEEQVPGLRAGLAQALAPFGIDEVRGLGSLPFVVLEVNAAQLAALQATSRVRAVALQGAAAMD